MGQGGGPPDYVSLPLPTRMSQILSGRSALWTTMVHGAAQVVSAVMARKATARTLPSVSYVLADPTAQDTAPQHREAVAGPEYECRWTLMPEHA